MALAIPAGLDVFDQDSARKDSFARILLLGAGRTGKTTSVALTAPGPVLIINCDDENATRPASAHGAKFRAINVTNRASLVAACNYGVALSEAGEVRTILLDTITMLSDKLLEELKVRKIEGFDMWNAYSDAMMGAVRRLDKAQAHVFALAHMTPAEAHVGILPAIPGQQVKVKIPQYYSDWVLFEVDSTKAEPERNFLLGPQKEWTAGGRNIRRSVKIPADVGKLFAELGVNP